MSNKEPKISIAIVDTEKCKPKECGLECKKNCPPVKNGKPCIEVSKTSEVAYISETLCIAKETGCNICVKKCPFGAIKIINLPKNLEKHTTHRYGKNSFKLHRLPTPRAGQVLGLVGINGIGKSTALKILGGKLKPNLGEYTNPPDWEHILSFFRGSELQNYMLKLQNKQTKSLLKPQYVDGLQKDLMKKGPLSIKQAIDQKNERDSTTFNYIIDMLELRTLYNEERDISLLSGGEMQRFAIAIVCIQVADVYMFDEPSSFLDVKQRLKAALCIRSLLTDKNYVICVEHDLAVLDYLSDFICCLYGKASVYGVVTMPFNVRDGINHFLKGFIPTENMRFRKYELSFKMVTQAEDGSLSIGNNSTKSETASKKKHHIRYPNMCKTLIDESGKTQFKLNVEEGYFTHSEIIVLLGQNGTGKTTFIKMLAGLKNYSPDLDSDGLQVELPQLNISYKPQTINPSFDGSVRQILQNKIKNAYLHTQFQTDVFKPLEIDKLLDMNVKTLSGGELQRVAITLCLGTPADVYLIDEPSAYLDAEQRINAAKVIKRYLMHTRKTGFIVEHDFIMATYLADKIILYDGIPSIECTAHSPQSLLEGMNSFLKQLNITFRRDPTNWRPRINKQNSVKDTEQKLAGNYFFLEST